MATAPAPPTYSELSFKDAIKHINTIHANLGQIKVYKYCGELIVRCQTISDLLLESKPKAGKKEQRHPLTDVFCRVVSHLQEQFTTWCDLGRLKSFLQRVQIKAALDGFHHDLDCGVADSRVDNDRLSVDSSDSAARDQDELRFVLQKIVENPNDMKSLLNLGAVPVEDLMECLQLELSYPELDPVQKQVFQYGLWFLYRTTTKLPPKSNLTGQIQLEGRYPVSESRHSKAYSGRWLNEESVVVLRPRSSLVDKNAFAKWATSARKLFHPNVAQIYGYASVDGEICLVQQRPGDPLNLPQVQELSVIDRIQIVIDVVTGLDYLHSNAVIHGDLCLSNVLISPRGVASVSGLLLSKPEHLPEADECPDGQKIANQVPHSQSASSDVWAFGVLCWEVLTGTQQPADPTDDTPVLSGYNDPTLPDRAGHKASTRRTWDDLLALTRQCLLPDWQSRPSMSYVQGEIVKLSTLLEDDGILPNSLSRSGSISTQGSHLSNTSQLCNRNRPSSPISIQRPTSSSGRRLSHSLSTNFRQLSIRSSLDHRAGIPPRKLSNAESISGSPKTPFPISPTSPQIATPVSAHSVDAALIEAITNQKSVIHLDEHALPLYATLQGLIDHLIREFDTGADTVYREIFFTGCSDFTTSEDMFAALSQRFEEAAKDRTYRLQCYRKSILKIIGYWLGERNYFISEELLGAMKQIGKMACSQKHCIEEQPVAQTIIKRVEDRLILQAQTSIVPVVPGRKLLRTSDITPRDLAVALTLLEGDLYRAILPADCISHLMEKPTPNNVKAAYLTNNKIVLWVKQSVLHYDDIAARAQVFKFFINVAVECQRLHNFASLTAIVNGLNSAPIERLRLTKKELSLPHRESLHALDQLLNPEANHRAYREELRKAPIDAQRSIGIPWIAVHLRELYATLQKNPPTIRVDGVPLINFRRYVRFTERIKQVLHFTPPDLERHRHHGHLAYIEHQLRSVYLEAQNDDDLMARSMALEAGESRDYKTRKRELKRLGFRA